MQDGPDTPSLPSESTSKPQRKKQSYADEDSEEERRVAHARQGALQQRVPQAMGAASDDSDDERPLSAKMTSLMDTEAKETAPDAQEMAQEAAHVPPSPPSDEGAPDDSDSDAPVRRRPVVRDSVERGSESSFPDEDSNESGSDDEEEEEESGSDESSSKGSISDEDDTPPRRKGAKAKRLTKNASAVKKAKTTKTTKTTTAAKPPAAPPAPAAPTAPVAAPAAKAPLASDSDSPLANAAPAPSEPPELQALSEPQDAQEPPEPQDAPASAVSDTAEGRRPAKIRRAAIVQDAKAHFDTLRHDGQISTKQYDDVQKVMHSYVDEGKVAQSNTFVSVLIDIVGHLAKPSGTQTPVQVWSKEPATAELHTTKETLRNATQLMHNLQPCVEQMEETMALLHDLVPKLAASTHATSRQLLSVAQTQAGSP